MSLFPAYANNDVETGIDLLGPVLEVSPAREEELLESEEERGSPGRPASPQARPAGSPGRPASPQARPAGPPAPRARSPPTRNDDFYLDLKSDYANVRCSTIYYPGRPKYSHVESTLGSAHTAAGTRRARKRRYFEWAASEAPRAHDEGAARAAAFRRMLADAPHDTDLWLQYIDFQERCGEPGAALEAAAEAEARRPRSRALRAARHRLARRLLPPDAYLAQLRDAIAQEKVPARAAELWERLLEALARAPGVDAPALGRAAAAAVRATAAHPPAYPHIIAAYGSFLRAAGLWELLVLLVELVASMSFPRSAAFPPPAPGAAAAAAAEERLLKYEDEVSASGLPLSARWVRVERARAAAHWRAAGAGAGAGALDPQRAPAAADVAELLLPVPDADAAFLLAAQLLRLAKVPMLPGGGYVRRAWALGATPLDGSGEALLPLLRAARRLPPAHRAAAAPARARRLLALLLDPPHYCSDADGFLSWVSALWEACCGWASGARREALLCWRLRWLHALALLCDPEEESGRAELKRLRGVARAALRAHAGASPLPFAQFARLEQRASGAAAAAAAAHAARAALRDQAIPHEQRLYVARVAAEICPENTGLWAVSCAALGRALPAEPELRAPPPPALRAAALAALERRCDELDDRMAALEDIEDEKPGARLCAALLPGEGEWAAARALLAPPARRLQLLRRARDRPPPADMGWRGLRYFEQAACALAARAPHGLRLAPLFPDNAFLALASSGRGAEGARDAAARRGSECGALADLLPPLMRALDAWEVGPERQRGPEAEAASRAAARAARRVAREGGGGALAWAALLEAAARASEPALAPERALVPALDAYPAHKWLYVRGAAWCGAEGAALADALLERQLRLHALPLELQAAADLPPPPPADPEL